MNSVANVKYMLYLDTSLILLFLGGNWHVLKFG